MRTSPQTDEGPGGTVQRCHQGKSLFLCALLFTAVIGLVLAIVFSIITCNLESCNTSSCLVLLARLQKAQNGTIDPCEDFFSYVCGNWEPNSTWGMDRPSVNVFDVVLEENLLIMKKLLEESPLGDNGSAQEKAMRFYASCMNTDQIEAQGAEPLKELINKIGGWNITGSWKETDFNQTLQILMEKYNTFPFFRAYVGPSSSDPSTNIIQIDHPQFELPLKYDLERNVNYPWVVHSYYLYLKKLGELMGGHTNATSTYFSLVLSFLSNLQKVVTPLKKRQEKRMLFYHTTIRKLQEKAPAIDWLSCLQAAFHPMQLNMSQTIAVHDMDYLKGMSQLIGKWQNRRDVLQIYMILCLIGNLSPTLDSQFQKAHQEFVHVLDSRMRNTDTMTTERWRKCLSDTSTFFGPVLGKMVVQEIFPQKAKDLAEEIFSEIRDALHSHLDQVNWMDSQSRQEAKEKIYRLQVEIGYPESIHQTNKADDEYQELKIEENNFFHNVVACLKSLQKRLLLRLVSPHLHDNWEVAPWSVHSYYSLRRHAVVFPAGMFRNPFFHTEFPSAVNFGVMGFFMAHELLHSLYDYVLPKNCSTCGMDIPAEGKDCLVKQYENYSLKGHGVNGSFTLLENLADTGGLAIAYQAYENWLAKHKGVTNLPRFGLSHHQLFFVSFAHAMCGYQSLESLQAFLHRDPHSPSPLRVIGSLSNSQDFSRHFQCPSESPMNPTLKCHIW
ncbi:endothelin-converting enzyme 2 isoform X1 [Python bivittatus]|uniref:Endothelin-converting enzyme 2 isoform X1 n=1 Tax=Python bivittatus TaxID=176946 RepID=A0A9F2RB22_PYTBI|nr:endothelin-converting enzyme 2 isoform X1 [Python bivittatus]